MDAKVFILFQTCILAFFLHFFIINQLTNFLILHLIRHEMENLALN